MNLFADERAELMHAWRRYRELLSRGGEATGVEIARMLAAARDLGLEREHVALHAQVVQTADELERHTMRDPDDLADQAREARQRLVRIRRENQAREQEAQRSVSGLEGELFALRSALRRLEGLRRAFPKLLAADVGWEPAPIAHPTIKASARRLGIEGAPEGQELAVMADTHGGDGHG